MYELRLVLVLKSITLLWERRAVRFDKVTRDQTQKWVIFSHWALRIFIVHRDLVRCVVFFLLVVFHGILPKNLVLLHPIARQIVLTPLQSETRWSLRYLESGRPLSFYQELLLICISVLDLITILFVVFSLETKEDLLKLFLVCNLIFVFSLFSMRYFRIFCLLGLLLKV